MAFSSEPLKNLVDSREYSRQNQTATYSPFTRGTRCDVVSGHVTPDPARVLARLHGILGAWAAEDDP